MCNVCMYVHYCVFQYILEFLFINYLLKPLYCFLVVTDSFIIPRGTFEVSFSFQTFFSIQRKGCFSLFLCYEKQIRDCLWMQKKMTFPSNYQVTYATPGPCPACGLFLISLPKWTFSWIMAITTTIKSQDLLKILTGVGGGLWIYSTF